MAEMDVLPDFINPETEAILGPLGELSQTPAKPRVKAPESRPFMESVRGAMRSGTPEGALSEAAAISIARSNDPRHQDGEARQLLETIGTGSPLESDVASKALARKEKRGTLAPSRLDQAMDSVFEQVSYDLSDFDPSVKNFTAALVGNAASVTNVLGFGGLLARKIPALAQSPVTRTALDAAISNTILDPVVQGVRVGSGGQEHYDIAQTAAAPVVGLAVGAGLGGIAKGLGSAIDRIDPPLPSTALSQNDRAVNAEAALNAYNPERAQLRMEPQTIDDVLNMPEQPSRSVHASEITPISEPMPTQFYGTPMEVPARLAELPAMGEPTLTFKESPIAPVRATYEAAIELATTPKTNIPGFNQTADYAPPVKDGPAARLLFNPLELNVDAKRFQFKEGGDESGVTQTLKGVTKWDDAASGQIIVWQQSDGKLFVVNGHQRTGLARRLAGDDASAKIEIPGLLYREDDGITAEDIRAIAAGVNIKEGSGTATDAAKILRSRPELLDGSMPLSKGVARQGRNLARLDDEAFRMVTNEIIPENYGSIIGEIIPSDGPRQVAAAKAIVRFEPRNDREASVLVQRVSQSELSKRQEGAQTSMFGDLESAESTAGEEMRIVARAIDELKKDKSLFSRVVANADRIEAEGSRIERDTAKGVAQEAELFARQIASDAYTAGPVRSALIAAARDLKDGSKSLATASQDVIAAARRQAESNVSARNGDSAGAGGREVLRSDQGVDQARAGQEGQARIAGDGKDGQISGRDPGQAGSRTEPGAEGKPQGLIPGVEPVTDRQRLDLAASKPLTGGNATPPAGGLFDENAINQKELFRRGAVTSGLPNQMEGGRPRPDHGTTPPVVPTEVQSLSAISRQLVDAFSSVAREGRVTPGAEGIYKLESGVIRVRRLSDFDTLTHEVGHDLHMGSRAKSDFDNLIRANVSELSTFGAGTSAEGNAEAFANLFHLYVTNTAFLQRGFPNSLAALDGLMQSKFPNEFAAIQSIRQALDVLRNTPSENLPVSITVPQLTPIGRAKESLKTELDPFGRKVYSFLDSQYAKYTDSAHPVYRAVEALAEIAKGNGKNVDIRPTDDAYILARRVPGAHGKADAYLKYGLDPEEIGPSVASGLEKALGKGWDDQRYQHFNDYLTARRMVFEHTRLDAGELARKPGAYNLVDWQNIVAAHEATSPTFRQGAEDIYAFQSQYLKRMLDKHIITREYFDLAMSRSDYVPLQRDMRDFVGNGANGGSVGGDGLLSRTVMERFKGSDRDVIHPIESILKRVHDIEFVIARNDSIRALAHIGKEAGPGSGYIVEHIPNHELRSQRVDAIEALKQAGKQAGLEDDVDLHMLITQAEDRLGDSTWSTLFHQEEIKPGAEPIVFYWENGERRALRLGDRRFGQELHHALTAMTDYERDMFVQVLSISSGILRAGVTRSLDFLLVNPIRDQFTAVLTGGRKYIPFVSMAKGLVDALQKNDVAIDFAKQGGLAGGAIVQALEASAFTHKAQNLITGGNLFEKVARAFELTETGTRVGLYESYMKQALELGLTGEDAKLWAVFRADDYIDFRKHGASMGNMRRIMTFMNANIQGTDKEIRAVMDLPVLERKRMAGETLSQSEMDRLKDARVGMIRLVSMGIILGAGLAVYNQGNEAWENAPKYTKDLNFMFHAGGIDFSVPKGFGVVQSVVNLFERGTEYSIRKDPTLAADWLKAAGSAFTPPMNNPLVSMAYDIPANYNRFQDRNIVPYYMQGGKASEQYSAYTSTLAKQLAQAANNVGLDASPMKIDYALHNMGGGMARDVLFAWDAAMGNDRPEKQIYDWPILRRFIKNSDRGSQATRAFYELVGEKTGRYEQAENAYRGKINNGERAAAEEFLRNMKDDEKVWTTISALGFSTPEKKMHPLYNARERVAVVNGMIRQLVTNNVIKEEDLDRRNMTVSRRDATPLSLTPRARAHLIEELQHLSVATTRNAMVLVEAKGTRGLGLMDTNSALKNVRAISPDVADEFTKRLVTKNLPDAGVVAGAWPEYKRRVLVDGENAKLVDLVPPKNRARSRR